MRLSKVNSKSLIGRIVIIFIFLLVQINNSSGFTSRYKLPDDAFEGIFQFQYKKLINTMVMGAVYNDSIYVPMKEIFSRLLIYYEFDHENQVMTGYFKKETNTFRFDFNNLKVKYLDKEFTITENEFLRNDLEIFVLPSFLARTIDLRLIADYSQLAIYVIENTRAGMVNDEDLLPLMQKYNRSRLHDRLKEQIANEFNFPLLYPRNYSFLNGGLMDYSLNFLKNKQSEFLSWGTNLGIELLGGDLNLNSFGFFNNGFNYQNFIHWRFGLAKNPYLTQFRAGYINTVTNKLSFLPSQVVLGGMLTNDPVQFDADFVNYILEEEMPLGWQVELYVNHQLREYQNTTAGKYRFEVPLYYGRTEIELKFYGPKGEKYSKRKNLDIPYLMLKPGELSYAIGGGWEKFESIYSPKIGEAKFGLGITRWLSWYNWASYYQLNNKPYFLSKLAINAFDNTFFAIEVNPERYFGIITYQNFDEWGSYFFQYMNFNLLNRDPNNPQVAMYNMNASLPEFNEIFPIRTTIAYSRRQFTMGAINIFTGRTSFNIDEFRFSANYNLSFRDFNTFNTIGNVVQSVAPVLTWVWREKPSFLDFLETTTFSFGTNYHITNDQFLSVSAGFTQRIAQRINLIGTMTRDLQMKINRYNLSLMMNFDELISQSTLNVLNNDYVISQGLSGGVGYDAFNQELFINSRMSGLQVGTSSAMLRFFLDDNANGIFDEGEQLVPNVNAKILQGGRRLHDKESGLSRYVGLQQYAEYNVVIDAESFPNPLWVAYTPTFTFVTDPNSTKIIDVPCYSTGVIEGQVTRNDGIESVPQAGVKIHILRTDSTFVDVLPVYSDGTYYKAGIPPGDYLAWVDSAQVAILNVKSVPELLTFTIGKTTYGDFVDGLNFELYTQEAYLAKAKNGSKKTDLDNGLRKQSDEEETKVSTTEEVKEIETATTTKEIETVTNTDVTVAEVSKPVPNMHSRIQIIPNETKLFTYRNPRDIGLTPQITEYLDAVIEYMKNNPRTEISIVGHTDNFGSLDETQKVSEQRAEAVVSYLISKGINRNRILSRGEGARAPIASNISASGRQQNRRIEIIVID